MVWCESIPFVATEEAKVLILGSMPGALSLQSQQYYAHPRNHFWPVIYTILGEPLPDSYEERIKGLLANRMALWDVVAACERNGSSDASITQVTANDFPRFLATHPRVKLVVFNGTKAAQLWRQQVHTYGQELACLTLPSTSPALARPLTEKIQAWMIIKDYL